jgi:DNA modification methylase
MPLPEPAHREDRATLYLGDCVEVMAAMEENSVDAICTDPPYGLEFMGREWDTFRVDPRAARWSAERSGGAGAGFGEASHMGGTLLPAFHKRRTTSTCRTCGKRDAFRNPHACGERADWVTIAVDATPIEARAFQNWCGLWAAEALRVVKPGGFLVAFGGTRTYHRLVCALEDVGWEIRDTLMWLHGMGFPKSLSVYRVTLEALKERYGDEICGCVAPGHSGAAGDDAGLRGGDPARGGSGAGEVSADSPRHPVLPGDDHRAGHAAMRELRDGDQAQAPGHPPLASPLLFDHLRGGGSEDPRQRRAEIRARVEADAGRDTNSRPRLPRVRQDADGERSGASRPPSETVQDGRDESSDEPCGVVRSVPSPGGGDHGGRVVVDHDRSGPRRTMPDNHGGQQRAVARICSWCGLPDPDWLDGIEPFGTGLKPAVEPITLARKPISESTVAANVLKHGTGAINVDVCRLRSRSSGVVVSENRAMSGANYGRVDAGTAIGRWPPNVILSHTASCELAGTRRVLGSRVETASPGEFEAFADRGLGGPRPARGVGDEDGMETVEDWRCAPWCPVLLLDERAGWLHGAGNVRLFDPAVDEYREGGADKIFGRIGGTAPQMVYDRGGLASRFFYCAKADAEDRDSSSHPTIKPVALMKWLVQLVTPPGGLVLDPMVGSGTTVYAARELGFRAIGIDKDPQSVRDATHRLRQGVLEFSPASDDDPRAEPAAPAAAPPAAPGPEPAPAGPRQGALF